MSEHRRTTMPKLARTRWFRAWERSQSGNADRKRRREESLELKVEEEAEEEEALEWQRLREKDAVEAFSAFSRKKLHRLQLKLVAMDSRVALGSDAEEESEAESERALASDAEAESEAEAEARAHNERNPSANAS